MRRKLTEYQKWLIAKYGGASPKESILNIVNAILTETKQDKFPVNLRKLAEYIGINPEPLYNQVQLSHGSLKIHEEELRISFKENVFREDYDGDGLSHTRMRFAYAHELIHCLGYDFQKKPACRIAPRPQGHEEEQLCNYGAGKFILPQHLLREYCQNWEGTAVEKIQKIASISKTSIYAVVNQLIGSNILLPTPDTIYILSSLNKGYHKTNTLQYRCLTSAHYNKQKEDLQFLPPYVGLGHVKNDKGEEWSLMRFHKERERNPSILEWQIDESELIVVDVKNKKDSFSVVGSHKKIGSSYVWSELKVQ